MASILVLIQPASAQTDPALKTSVLRTLDAYLTSGGPSKAELDSGSDMANWSILKDVGIPTFQKDASLRKGTWENIWSPLENVLVDYEFGGSLRPLQVLTLWEESRKDHSRFVRLLGREKVLDPKQPAQRNKGRRFRVAVGEALSKLSPVRANARYEDMGWKFTATASLAPGTRIVRVAITGSQPCKITGSARTASLTLKGRLFEDPDSEAGVKVQILDRSFKSKGCELNLRDRFSTVARLAGGGETKVAGGLNIVFQDELVNGRLQIDLVSKQVGVALLTGRAVYTIRGKVTSDGKLDAQLIPVSRSGSNVLKQTLEMEGTLTGTVSNSAGRGQIVLPVLKDPLDWQSERAARKR
jgi:hypothetical protein